MFIHKNFTIGKLSYDLDISFRHRNRDDPNEKFLIEIDLNNCETGFLSHWADFFIKNGVVDIDTKFDGEHFILSSNKDFKNICQYYTDKYFALKAFL